MKKSVCVIDDDEIYRMISKKMIHRAGVFENVTFYKNAQEALKNFQTPEFVLPEVILLDINMPLLDGWQFLKSCEDLYPDLYEASDIYIVSSSISESDRERLRKFPYLKGFITKPLTVQKLKNLVS